MTDGVSVSGGLSARVLAERYRIDHCIAIGAMGEVWRAEDLALRRPMSSRPTS